MFVSSRLSDGLENINHFYNINVINSHIVVYNANTVIILIINVYIHASGMRQPQPDNKIYHRTYYKIISKILRTNNKITIKFLDYVEGSLHF